MAYHPRAICRVLPPSEFSVMIPELRVTLQGAATGRIHCHDSIATCHIAGAVTWRNQCHDCTTLQEFYPPYWKSFFAIFYFFVLSARGGFRVVSDTLVYIKYVYLSVFCITWLACYRALARKCGALLDDDVHLFVCPFVCRLLCPNAVLGLVSGGFSCCLRYTC